MVTTRLMHAVAWCVNAMISWNIAFFVPGIRNKSELSNWHDNDLLKRWNVDRAKSYLLFCL